jgi:lipopolysaccharide/colanic/teichoic acid biosynthesis glycosyltransferase
MNDLMLLVAGAALGLICCVFGAAFTYRKHRQLRVSIAMKAKAAERELLKDVQQIGKDELEKTPSGRELLALLEQTSPFEASPTEAPALDIKRERLQPRGTRETPITSITRTYMSREPTPYDFFKRLLDITTATLALMALSPLMLVVAVLVKLDSPGPAIFKQKRVGLRRRADGHRELWQTSMFTLYKFRTMYTDVDPELDRAFLDAFIRNDHRTMATPQSQDTRSRKLVRDPRVTRVGRFLRRTSLDELPQLWNVLEGDMSLVGPRPPIPYEVAEYEPWHRQRLWVKPGLTGLWQVTAESSGDFNEMVRLDIQYIQRRSLWLDLKILLLTIPAALRGGIEPYTPRPLRVGGSTAPVLGKSEA